GPGGRDRAAAGQGQGQGRRAQGLSHQRAAQAGHAAAGRVVRPDERVARVSRRSPRGRQPAIVKPIWARTVKNSSEIEYRTSSLILSLTCGPPMTTGSADTMRAATSRSPHTTKPARCDVASTA